MAAPAARSTGAGARRAVASQNVFRIGLVQVLTKGLPENLSPGDLFAEKPLHCAITTAFPAQHETHNMLTRPVMARMANTIRLILLFFILSSVLL